MPITAGTLFRDTVNFFRNQFSPVLQLCGLIAVITLLVAAFLEPHRVELLNLLSKIGEDASQGKPLQEIPELLAFPILKSLLVFLMPSLVGSILLTGSSIMLVHQVSQGQSAQVSKAIIAMLPTVPRLLLLLIVQNLILALGFILPVPLLTFLPQIFGSIVFLVAIVFCLTILCLAPILLFVGQKSVLSSLLISYQMAIQQFRLVLPIIALWLSFSLFLFLLTLSQNPSWISLFIRALLANLLFIFQIIYLYRLYILFRK